MRTSLRVPEASINCLVAVPLSNHPCPYAPRVPDWTSLLLVITLTAGQCQSILQSTLLSDMTKEVGYPYPCLCDRQRNAIKTWCDVDFSTKFFLFFLPPWKPLWHRPFYNWKCCAQWYNRVARYGFLRLVTFLYNYRCLALPLGGLLVTGGSFGLTTPSLGWEYTRWFPMLRLLFFAGHCVGSAPGVVGGCYSLH